MNITHSPEPLAAPSPAPKRGRLPSIDILRGVVMAVMALDHVRDYFSDSARIRLMDPEQSTAELMLTRWLAQFCAPAFFLLAGIGAYLSLSGGKSTSSVARYLFTRGLFLILLDLTLVRLAWDFNFRYDGGAWFIVLTTLGVSMMVLAGLIFLPRPWIVAFSVLLIAGHNLFDNMTGEEWGALEPLFILLHVRGESQVAGISFYVTYPLIPWIGVMSLGFALGPILRGEGALRRRQLFLLGFVFTLSFVVLRGFNLYGDPRPWLPDPGKPLTILAFLRTKKYPASLQHILMTLGPLLMGLAALDRIKTPGAIARWFIQFGRAPLYFYILHIYVIHALAVLAGWMEGYPARDFLVPYDSLPDGYGFSLPVVYAVWVVVLVVCYPICVWFDKVKRRSKSVWLSYL